MAAPTDLDADAALSAILARVRPLPAETSALEDARGRFLARDLRARTDNPPFDNSAMDGFALRARDARGALRVAQLSRAGGALPRPLRPGEAARIMTGAPLPRGADAVVPRELAREAGGLLRVDGPVRPGQHVRRRAGDVRRGQVLLRGGARIRPWEIAILAAQGFSRVPVSRVPRVGVLCSGDELVDFRRAPGPGRIRDSNGPALRAQLESWGFTAVDLGRCADEPAALRRAFRRALGRVDALVVSGGVSVGDFDHTRKVLEGLGMRTAFWRVRIKPGKPLLFGTRGRVPVFGLPGNPISSLVCSQVFLRPALERLAGAEKARAGEFPLRARLARAFRKPARLRQYIFCRGARGRDGMRLEALQPQVSGFAGMGSRAEFLAVGPEGEGALRAGRILCYRRLT